MCLGGMRNSDVGHTPATLTPRERGVLTLLGGGLSNAELADALQLTEATIKTHISRILTKLRIRDRVQAVVIAYQTGLVTPLPDHSRPTAPGK
jgi:DNA-binding NarL/FixJ family response regulator